MKKIKIIICICVLVVPCLVYGINDTRTFQFAPPKTEDRSRVIEDKTAASQLSQIDILQNKIVSLIPKKYIEKVLSFDVIRKEKGLTYEILRDDLTPLFKSTKSNQGKDRLSGNAQTTVSPDNATTLKYYWYSFLAFSFGNLFVFYGAIVLAIFLIVRLILKRFNYQ